jgi:hypothetical protein
MKLLSFLRWKIKQTSFEDICWYSGMILISISILRDVEKVFLFAGFVCWMGIFVKLLVNNYKQQYQEFKEEQNKLFETIKHSDQK